MTGIIHDFSTKNGTIAAIKYECESNGISSKEQIAYVLATVEHETAGTFKPVIEAYWLKNPDAYLKRHHPEYYPFYGRGFVQLTWEHSYRKYGELLKIDLVKKPELALNPNIALFTLVHGFAHGSFSGKKITDYINATKADFFKARQCINGLDDARLIANLTKNIYKQLKGKLHMNKIATQLLTGKDNETHDLVRWLTVIAVLVGIGLQIYDAVRSGEFDLQQYGIGIGMLLGSSATALKIKETTEP